jgi:hypothetical protein
LPPCLLACLLTMGCRISFAIVYTWATIIKISKKMVMPNLCRVSPNNQIIGMIQILFFPKNVYCIFIIVKHQVFISDYVFGKFNFGYFIDILIYWLCMPQFVKSFIWAIILHTLTHHIKDCFKSHKFRSQNLLPIYFIHFRTSPFHSISGGVSFSLRFFTFKRELVLEWNWILRSFTIRFSLWSLFWSVYEASKQTYCNWR